jgi:membrane-associated phospholipid phosphatase
VDFTIRTTPILNFCLSVVRGMQSAMSNRCDPLPHLDLSSPLAEIHRSPTERSSWAFWLVPPLILLLLAAGAMTVDVPVAQWAQGRNYPRVVREMMSLAEAFGHGVGAAVVLATVFTLDPGNRRTLWRSVLAIVAGGCGANLTKLLISRSRPATSDLLHVDSWQTFGGWFPLGHNGSGWQSFPSAHTATAVALALALAWLYPRGRHLFALFALAVGIQRVLGGAHFPSDALAGAAVGWWCAVAVLRRPVKPATE